MINLFSAFNIVIVARNFNPTLFNHYWLVKNEFIAQEDSIKGSRFEEDVIQINSDQFVLTVTPQQLIFVPKQLDNIDADIETLKKIVTKIPETPFSAIGINFTYQLFEDETIFELARKMFYNNKLNLYKHFDGTNSNFGSYLSKDVEGFAKARLRLNILPINNAQLKNNDDGPAKRLQLSFNYHLDYNVINDEFDDIISFLSSWKTFEAESLLIIKSVSDDAISE